jgi:hypothetical protein
MESSGSEAGSEIGRANDSHYDSSPSATRPVSTEPTACNLRLTPADKTTEQRTHRDGERSPSHGSSTLANSPPATSTVPPPLCTIKPDPEDSPVAAASEKPVLSPSPPREEAENGGEEEDSFCNGEAINIADLVDTVISEEMQLAKSRCRRQPLIQVRTDIVDVGGAMRGKNSNSSSVSSSSNNSSCSSSAFSIVASAADRGLDLTWPAAASRMQSASSSSSSSPDSQLSKNGERQQQQAAILRYPGGPPEGRHLYLPAAAANQSFNRQIGVATTGSPRHISGGSQSPSGVDSMLNGGLGSSGRIPPPLIR